MTLTLSDNDSEHSDDNIDIIVDSSNESVNDSGKTMIMTVAISMAITVSMAMTVTMVMAVQ